MTQASARAPSESESRWPTYVAVAGLGAAALYLLRARGFGFGQQSDDSPQEEQYQGDRLDLRVVGSRIEDGSGRRLGTWRTALDGIATLDTDTPILVDTTLGRHDVVTGLLTGLRQSGFRDVQYFSL